MARAESLLSARDFAGALALLEPFARKSPRDAHVHFLVGICRLRSGDPARAETAFRAAARLQPRDPMTAYYLGVALERLGRTRESRAAFKQALKLNPQFAQARAKIQGADPPAPSRGALTITSHVAAGSQWQLPRRGSAVVVGTARRVRIGAPAIGRGYRFTVLSFRVERDMPGAEPQAAQVQWDGYELSGMIEEGDRVHVAGKVRNGRIEPTSIRNLDTGADVKVKPFAALRKVGAALLAALLWVGGFAVLIGLLAG